MANKSLDIAAGLCYKGGMRNHLIVKKLRPFTSALPWNQLRTLTNQQVIDNISPPLTASQLTKMPIWGYPAIEWLKGEWLRDEKAAIISDYMRQSRLDAQAAEKLKVTDWLITTKGISTDTANALYDECNAILEAE
jgi:hypothetical protein